MKNLLQHIRIGYWLKCYFNSPKISIGLLLISLLMNVYYIVITNELFFFLNLWTLLNIAFCSLSALYNFTLLKFDRFIIGLIQIGLSGIGISFLYLMLRLAMSDL